MSMALLLQVMLTPVRSVIFPPGSYIALLVLNYSESIAFGTSYAFSDEMAPTSTIVPAVPLCTCSTRLQLRRGHTLKSLHLFHTVACLQCMLLWQFTKWCHQEKWPLPLVPPCFLYTDEMYWSRPKCWGKKLASFSVHNHKRFKEYYKYRTPQDKLW